MDKAVLRNAIEDSLARSMDDAGTLTARSIFASVLSPPLMQSYLASYYQTDFYDRALSFLEQQTFPKATLSGKMKRSLFEEHDYKSFMSKDVKLGEHGLRPHNVYPLTLAELAEAQGYLENADILKQTLAGFQAGIVSYLETVQKGADWIFPEGSDEMDLWVDTMERMQDNASGFSMFHDLLPIMALKIGDVEKPTGRDFHAGLALAFRKSAFRSYDGTTKNFNNQARCPFSKVVGHLADTMIERDASGQTVAARHGAPGALLSYIAHRMDVLEQRRLKSDASPCFDMASPF